MFVDRKSAGIKIWDELEEDFLAIDRPIVIALPKGGLPVGYEISKRLSCPLDVFVVKKIGTPNNPELALGAVSELGDIYLNREIVNHYAISIQELDQIISACSEVVRSQAVSLRGRGHSPVSVADRNIILVDDGIATGATMKAAIKLLRNQRVKSVNVAVPVCARDTWNDLKKLADQVHVLQIPPYFVSVGGFYKHFPQVSLEEAKTILKAGRRDQEKWIQTR